MDNGDAFYGCLIPDWRAVQYRIRMSGAWSGAGALGGGGAAGGDIISGREEASCRSERAPAGTSLRRVRSSRRSPPVQAAMRASLLLIALGSRGVSGACSDHSGAQACAKCAGAAGSLGGHCGWCPVDDKCAQCLGAECKIQTKCAGNQMITAAAQCPSGQQNWTAPVSKLIPSCEFERITW